MERSQLAQWAGECAVTSGARPVRVPPAQMPRRLVALVLLTHVGSSLPPIVAPQSLVQPRRPRVGTERSRRDRLRRLTTCSFVGSSSTASSKASPLPASPVPCRDADCARWVPVQPGVSVLRLSRRQIPSARIVWPLHPVIQSCRDWNVKGCTGLLPPMVPIVGPPGAWERRPWPPPRGRAPSRSPWRRSHVEPEPPLARAVAVVPASGRRARGSRPGWATPPCWTRCAATRKGELRLPQWNRPSGGAALEGCACRGSRSAGAGADPTHDATRWGRPRRSRRAEAELASPAGATARCGCLALGGLRRREDPVRCRGGAPRTPRRPPAAERSRLTSSNVRRMPASRRGARPGPPAPRRGPASRAPVSASGGLTAAAPDASRRRRGRLRPRSASTSPGTPPPAPRSSSRAGQRADAS